MSILQIDFETRSTVDLRNTGVYPYAEDPTTDIWCMAWAFDDEEPEIWTPAGIAHYPNCSGVSTGRCDRDCPGNSAGLPVRIVRHIMTGGEIHAWNAAFERIIWREIMVKRYHAPAVPLEQWHDTAARSAAMALPRKLDQAARVTGVEQQKDAEGYGLMMRMTRPRKILEDGTLIWWDVEERLERLFAYCKQDVRTERAIGKLLLPLTPMEREHYLETERANDRGIYIDVPLVQAAKALADEGVQRANAALQEITGGMVQQVTKVEQIKLWLRSKDIHAASIAKAPLKEMLTSDLDPQVRAVLELRAEAGRSSLAKLDKMTEALASDGAVHGTLSYHGASTGRWSGYLLQPHNFAKGEVPGIEDYIPDVLAQRYDFIDLIYPPTVVVSSLQRSMVRARPGNEFVAGDFSAIEARVVNWLADQQDMLELFAKMDAAPKHEKELFDPYRHNAARLYEIPLEQVKKFPHRHTGKFQELACGFGMGPDKAVTAGKDIYNIILTPQQAKDIVNNYRQTHQRVKQLWHDAQRAALDAVAKPGEVVTFGGRRNLRFVVQGDWLFMLLPSHRALSYASPRIVDRATPWGETRPAVEISVVDSKTHQWVRQAMYGGLWVENATQAIARDLMAEGTLRLRDAGYPYVLTVHDEIVTEVVEGFGSIEEFDRLACVSPEWATGCPVATESWRGTRYRK